MRVYVCVCVQSKQARITYYVRTSTSTSTSKKHTLHQFQRERQRRVHSPRRQVGHRPVQYAGQNCHGLRHWCVHFSVVLQTPCVPRMAGHWIRCWQRLRWGRCHLQVQRRAQILEGLVLDGDALHIFKKEKKKPVYYFLYMYIFT